MEGEGLRKRIGIVILLSLVLLFFYKVFAGMVLLPADLSLRLQPWRSYSHLLFPSFRKVYNPLLDVILYFYPWRVLLERSLREGFIPLWNSYNFCGQPFLANMASACLYPLNWLLLFIPAHIFMTINIIFHFFLTSLFAYLFFQSLGLRKLSALLGAIIWTFSGPMVVWAEYQTPISSMCWLPLSLYLWQLFLSKRSPIYAVLSSPPLALSILAGHTQFALYGWFAFVSYAIFTIFSQKLYKEGFLGLFVSLSLGFALSLPQLLPSFELLGRSHRSLGTSFSDLLTTAMPLRHLYTFIVPDFYGNPVDYNYRGAFNYVELCGYFGLLPFFLFPFALKRKEGFFFLSLSIFSLLFALKTPVLKLLLFLPVFKSLSAPARDLYLVAFSFSTLAALGMENLPPKNSRVPFIVFFLLLLLLALGLSQQSELVGFPPLSSLLIFLLIAILTSLFIHLRKSFALIILAIVDMFTFGIRFNPALPTSMLFPSTPATQKIRTICKDGRFLALAGVRDPLDTLLPNCNILLNLREVQGGDSLYPLRALLFIQAINGSKERSNALYVRNPFSPLISLTGVRYVFSKEPIEKPQISVLYGGEIFLLENKGAFPRFYLVGDTMKVKNKEQALANIHHCTIGRAIIENGEELNNGMPRYSIKVLEDRSGSLMVKVKTDRKSYLVITETFYPGWKGFIDGKEEKIFPANLLFQALLIPKGEHIVRVAYRPISYKLGLYISLLFSSFIIAFLLSFKRRGKEEKSLKGKA
ncbi:MAG: hypothetical protein ACPL7E_00080 [bacterium]